MEITAGIQEVERDAAPMWPAAKRTRSMSLQAHCLRAARFLRLAKAETRAMASEAEQFA